MNSKKTIVPFLDKYLANPLRFMQNNKAEAAEELGGNVIVLSQKKRQKLNDGAPAAQAAPKQTPRKVQPRTLAEAVSAYTGSTYGKKRKAALIDSDEDVGEPVSGAEDVGEEIAHLESNDSSNDVFESASEYQSSDSDFRATSKEPSEPESLSEEPEDLETLKHDLKRDEAQQPPQPVPQQLQAQPEADQPDTARFYGFNERRPDRGANSSARINKSYQKAYLAKKPLGLLNQGVTCYMNTAIQLMIHIPAVTNYLAEVHGGKHGGLLPRSVTHILADLAHRVWNLESSKKRYIHPKRIISRLEDINCMMSEWQQEDSHEYFMSVMSRLQEDSTPRGVKLNQSIVYDIFGGLLNQTVTCEKCRTKSETKQEFYDLLIGFKSRKKSKPYTIKKSIGDFFSNELIRADKADPKLGYYCERCKSNNNADKYSTIDTAPETLTVHLKRFKFNGNQLMKVKQLIKYSNYVDLTPYTTHKTPAVYKLISIILHEGRSLSSGHYILHCLQPDNTWATYDDEYCNTIREAEALNDPSAYVLVYSKLTPRA